MKLYNINNREQDIRELQSDIEYMVQEMYPAEWLGKIPFMLHDSLNKARKDSVKLVIKIRATGYNKKLPVIEMSDSDYKVAVQTATDDKKLRGLMYEYRNIGIRITMLNTLCNPDLLAKKLGFIVNKLLVSITKASIYNVTNEVSLSQVIANTSKWLKPKGLALKDNSILLSSAESDDQLKSTSFCLTNQLLNELANADYLNLRLSNRMHMYSIPEGTTDLFDNSWWEDMADRAAVIQSKTVLLEPATTDKTVITTSSWYYNTPTFSSEVNKFIDTMHNVKYKFKSDALDRVHDCAIDHFRGDIPKSKFKVLPHHLAAIERFKKQIIASNDNGGHYILGKFDSVLRYYYISEFGHFQTSSALRSLLEVDGIEDPIKYDMVNNAMQIDALSIKNKPLACYVGLVAETHCKEDFRILVANELNSFIGDKVFDKSKVKPPFMLWSYNAGKKLVLEGSYTEEISMFTGKVYRTVKSKGLLNYIHEAGLEVDSDALWDKWAEIMNKYAAGIVALKLVFNRLTKANPVSEVSWAMPDGGVCQYTSVDKLDYPTIWVNKNGTVRHHNQTIKQIVEGAKNAGLFPRCNQSIDAFIERRVVIKANELGIVVVPNHDAFMFDKKYKDTMFNIIKEVLVEVLEGDVMGNIVEQLNETKTPLFGGISIESDTLTREDIMAGTPCVLEDI